MTTENGRARADAGFQVRTSLGDKGRDGGGHAHLRKELCELIVEVRGTADRDCKKIRRGEEPLDDCGLEAPDGEAREGMEGVICVLGEADVDVQLKIIAHLVHLLQPVGLNDRVLMLSDDEEDELEVICGGLRRAGSLCLLDTSTELIRATSALSNDIIYIYERDFIVVSYPSHFVVDTRGWQGGWWRQFHLAFPLEIARRRGACICGQSLCEGWYKMAS